ncbi:MAG: class I SAM-dependent methyltransferase [Actinomycetota bacterium]|nr:class I SAM-dependent methyltransferase [Actinomycetota bacterium]
MLASVAAPTGRSLRVLDLGCGDGTMAARIAAGPRPVAVVGLDWTHDGVRSAARRGVAVVQASVDDSGLPLRAGAFDVVLFSEVVEHLVDPDLALAEIRRVLIPGGTLLLSTPNLAAWFNRLLLLAGVQPVFSEVSRLGVFGRPGREVVGHLRLFTARALVEVLAAHGFVDVTLAGATFHDVPRLARWLDRLCARRPGVAAILLARARTKSDPPA